MYFKKFNWAILPPSKNNQAESSYHLYLLRFDKISEYERDEMIHFISSKNIGVNVHYIPMPMLTFFKNLGYNIKDYPETYKMYSNEISLPIYNKLSKVQLKKICDTVVEAFQSLKK